MSRIGTGFVELPAVRKLKSPPGEQLERLKLVRFVEPSSLCWARSDRVFGEPCHWSSNFFGDDVHHATCRTVAVTRGSRATWIPSIRSIISGGTQPVSPRVSLATPAQTNRIAAGDRLAVDQDQVFFRAHTTDINLAVVTALAAGGVTGQVNARHGADDFRPRHARADLRISSAVMVGNPGACKFCSAAVITMVSSCCAEAVLSSAMAGSATP